MIEYALLAFLVAVVSILLLTAIGFDLQEVFDKVEESLGISDPETPVSAGDDDTEPTTSVE